MIPARFADPDGRMGDYAIQAAEATYRQALSVGLNTTKVSALSEACDILGSLLAAWWMLTQMAVCRFGCCLC